MTALLQKVIAQVEALPEETQNALASDWLEALESERKWDDVFAKHANKMDKLEEMVLAEIASGQTQPMEKLWDEFDVKES